MTGPESFGIAQAQNKRDYQEDAYSYSAFCNCKDTINNFVNSTDDQRVSFFKQLFQNLDNDICNKIGSKQTSWQDEQVGSTAILSAIIGKKIYTCALGDARSFACIYTAKGVIVRPLSDKIHTTANSTEAVRIRTQGGAITHRFTAIIGKKQLQLITVKREHVERLGLDPIPDTTGNPNQKYAIFLKNKDGELTYYGLSESNEPTRNELRAMEGEGFMLSAPDIRVNETITVTRSFGDHTLTGKENKKLIIALPEVSVCDIEELLLQHNPTKIQILNVSDGVVDAFINADKQKSHLDSISNFINKATQDGTINNIKQADNFDTNFANSLVERAVALKACDDNMTALVKTVYDQNDPNQNWDENIRLMGVYDGHGGSKVSEYLGATMGVAFKWYLNRLSPEIKDTQINTNQIQQQSQNLLYMHTNSFKDYNANIAEENEQQTQINNQHISSDFDISAQDHDNQIEDPNRDVLFSTQDGSLLGMNYIIKQYKLTGKLLNDITQQPLIAIDAQQIELSTKKQDLLAAARHVRARYTYEDAVLPQQMYCAILDLCENTPLSAQDQQAEQVNKIIQKNSADQDNNLSAYMQLLYDKFYKYIATLSEDDQKRFYSTKIDYNDSIISIKDFLKVCEEQHHAPELTIYWARLLYRYNQAINFTNPILEAKINPNTSPEIYPTKYIASNPQYNDNVITEAIKDKYRSFCAPNIAEYWAILDLCENTPFPQQAVQQDKINSVEKQKNPPNQNLDNTYEYMQQLYAKFREYIKTLSEDDQKRFYDTNINYCNTTMSIKVFLENYCDNGRYNYELAYSLADLLHRYNQNIDFTNPVLKQYIATRKQTSFSTKYITCPIQYDSNETPVDAQTKYKNFCKRKSNDTMPLPSHLDTGFVRCLLEQFQGKARGICMTEKGNYITRNGTVYRDIPKGLARTINEYSTDYKNSDSKILVDLKKYANNLIKSKQKKGTEKKDGLTAADMFARYGFRTEETRNLYIDLIKTASCAAYVESCKKAEEKQTEEKDKSAQFKH